MRKLMLVFILGILLISLVVAKIENNSNSERIVTTNADGSKTINKTIITPHGVKTMIQTKTRECDTIDNVTKCNRDVFKTITFDKTKGNQTIIISKNVSAHTDLEIDVDKDNNETYVDIHGYKKVVKIMPDTAADRALERLKLKVCNETNNCTIILKDVGNNQTEMQYELQVDRHYKLLGMFKTKAQVRAEIGADSGNVTITKKPWWAFLASSSD